MEPTDITAAVSSHHEADPLTSRGNRTVPGRARTNTERGEREREEARGESGQTEWGVVSRASQTWPPHLFTLLLALQPSPVSLQLRPRRHRRQQCAGDTPILVFSIVPTVSPTLSRRCFCPYLVHSVGGTPFLVNFTLCLPPPHRVDDTSVLIYPTRCYHRPRRIFPSSLTSSHECFTLFVDFAAPTIPLNSLAVSPFASFAKKCRLFSRIYVRLSSYALHGAAVSCIHLHTG